MSVQERYASQALIPGWKQAVLRDARVLVGGIGTLGWRVAQLLAILGVKELHFIERDVVEERNRGRIEAFADWDGSPGVLKADLGAAELRRINPEVDVEAFPVDVVHGFGSARYAEYDLVFMAFDNYTARFWMHQYARLAGVPVIEGATEKLVGWVTVSLPDDESGCFACAGDARARLADDAPKSCVGLYVDEEGAKIPMLAAPAAIVAGMMVNEGLKVLFGGQDGFPEAKGGMRYLYDAADATRPVMPVKLPRNASCPHHERLDALEHVRLGFGPDTKVGELRSMAAHGIGADRSDVFLTSDWDILHSWTCPACGHVHAPKAPASAMKRLQCAACGRVVARSELDEIPVELHPSLSDEDATLAEYHQPERHILKAEVGSRVVRLVPLA